jgi:hypothetical protein
VDRKPIPPQPRHAGQELEKEVERLRAKLV